MQAVIQPDLVSTIIPVYNRPKMVRRAVASVLAQTYRPIEILLVDDGSTDATPEVLAELQTAHPEEIRVIRQANAGAGPARETGRLQAHGAYIQYLDSDDYLLPNKFTDQVAALKAHPECAIAYGTSRLETAAGQVLDPASRRTDEAIASLFPLLLLERWWHTHTPLFRRWISDAAGPWPSYRPEDWDLEARMGALRPQLIHCGTTVSVQVDHDSPNRVTRGAEAAFLRDEAIFLPRLHACALLAGMDRQVPELALFSRWCFLRARQLDAIGEGALADGLLALARYSGSADPPGSAAWQLPAYQSLRRLLGPRTVGSLAALHHPRHPQVASG
ncbi:glycosyltransferase family A protein [Synechococcus sp. CBW1004]|uniref:glycosyltransferase family 2 protein n=1 Tax=Synechococcus sp. CBW1004 TaxID=1353136 RepID=UPI0018CCD9FA|nr:glycosyltransferase family A protein [Synechococcus sp. CBW1004]QPN64309.1 glycosyltransferase family 2 protein [Synechococcus sp. CBW1004]